MKYKLIMNGLDCANCAAKVERAIADTEGFEEVSLVFATKSLYFNHAPDEHIVEIVQEITNKVEDGVEVSEFVKKHHHEHHHHNHCHDDHCDCGHEHHHEEHEHHHEHHHEGSRLSNILLFVAIGFAAAALLLDIFKVNEIAVAMLSAVAIVLSGYKVCISGVKSVLRLDIDETTLMTIAVIAAFCLGQFVEGAMVTILYGIGELLEDKAVESSRRSIEKLANIQADTAHIIEHGAEHTVPAEEVEAGAEIVIYPHERIPLDCVITDGSGSADASAITGESMPINCEKGTELLSGMLNGDSVLRATTTKDYHESTASRIIELVEEASVTKSKNEKLITRFARFYTPIVMLISIAIAFIPPIFVGNLTDWIYRGLVCLVASCPCAIVISVPLAYYSGIGAASKQGVLIKGGKFLEALNRADTVIFDKTGTLTEGVLEVSEIIPHKNYDKDTVLALAASLERHSSHPIAKAIVEKYSGGFIEMENYGEKSGYGVSALYNGRELYCGAKRGTDNKAGAYLVYDGDCIGEFILSDKVRSEAGSVIAQLKSIGLRKAVMLTGDNSSRAAEVKNELNLDEAHAELLPQDKLNLVNGYKENGSTTVFVGDGINDSPVITAADCGFAMGFGSEAAIASADAVLTSGTLSALPKAFRIAKKTVLTSKINIAFALLIKAIVIVLAFFGLAAIWMSVVADTGVCMLCVLYATRLLRIKYDK